MMKRRIPATLAVAVLLVAAAACGPSHTSSTPHATYQPPPNKTQLEHQAQKCAQGANFLTKTGRHTYAKCVSPGNPQQVQNCVEKNLPTASLATHAGRQVFINKIGACA